MQNTWLLITTKKNLVQDFMGTEMLHDHEEHVKLFSFGQPPFQNYDTGVK